MPWNPEHYDTMKPTVQKKNEQEPFYSQWYWQTAKMYPYKKTKAYYHGPREEWMYLMKDKDE